MKTWEVWDELVDRWDGTIDRMPSRFSPQEQVVCRVKCFLSSFEAGGWLYNISPLEGAGQQWTELRATADSMAAVGAHQTARDLHHIVNIVENVSIQEPGTWGEFLAAADPLETIDQIEKTISDDLPQLWDKLNEYTLTHFECERD